MKEPQTQNPNERSTNWRRRIGAGVFATAALIAPKAVDSLDLVKRSVPPTTGEGSGVTSYVHVNGWPDSQPAEPAGTTTTGPAVPDVHLGDSPSESTVTFPQSAADSGDQGHPVGGTGEGDVPPFEPFE